MHGVSDHGESSLEVSGNNMHVRRRWPSRELEAAGFEQFRANANVFQCPYERNNLHDYNILPTSAQEFSG